MSGPRHLLAAWPELRRRIAGARHIALFTDFDGTLTRIRPRPEEVWLAGAVRKLLAELAARGVAVGVVSGRALEDVRARVGVPGIWYLGAHGFFLRTPGNRNLELLHPQERAQVARAYRALARKLRGLPGIRLEHKSATVAVHYRGASPRSRILAHAAVIELAKGMRGLRLLPGKKVWEVTPESPRGSSIDKGRAIKLALRQERRRRSGHWLVFYLGDDQADEEVFEKLDGISVVIGRRRRTAARFYLWSPAEMRRFLEAFLQVLP